ncbi:hypothetical protein [Demequina oxidasica]|uniref:hypothetical protein n=1 Tax=Demequina oxidasica TaxID=676199 RepID=UPI000781547E|nr:hypothetical protein [Demequina oxidasica]
MSVFVVALVGAGAVFLAGWLSQPGRRAVGIRRYVDLLNDLPKESAQRDPLAAEIDKMIKVELQDRRLNEIARAVGFFFFSLVLAIFGSLMAGHTGGFWWIVAVEFWMLTAGIAVIFFVGLLRRKADKASGDIKQEQ